LTNDVLVLKTIGASFDGKGFSASIFCVVEQLLKMMEMKIMKSVTLILVMTAIIFLAKIEVINRK
jgi:hypothetical protein